MMKLRFLGFILLGSVLFVACSGNQQKKDTKQLEKSLVDEVKQVVTEVPPPEVIEVINAINKAGAGYIFDITNDISNKEQYLSTWQKAVNLGIFASDLTYVSIYQKKDEVGSYVKVVMDLMEELELPTSENNILERIESNLDNKDSIAYLIDESMVETNQFLNENQRTDVALFALAGSWIENMYLVDKTIEFAEDTKPLYDIILDNRAALKKIIELMEEYKDTENFNTLYTQLVELNDLFEKLMVNRSNTELQDTLKEKIESLRASVV